MFRSWPAFAIGTALVPWEVAGAHPPVSGNVAGTTLTPDAYELLASDVLSGPSGCFQAKGTVSWAHTAGRFATKGAARTHWRFDHRVWRLDSHELESADPDSLEVRVAPMLLGGQVAVDLRYPTTRNRVIDWPGPVATLPTRLFGEIASVVVDRVDGNMRIVESFDWDGWKRVSGDRRTTFDDKLVPLSVDLDATDRWPNGCRVRSVVHTDLGPRRLPTREVWRWEGRCPLSTDWEADWVFTFEAWKPCRFSGPADPSAGSL